MTAHRIHDHREDGFTVVEILITLAVTLIGLGGLLSLHHVISTGAATANRMAEASAIADAAVEEVRQLRYAEIETRFGPPPFDVELEQAAGKGERVYDRRLLMDPLTAVSPDLFRVRIEVTWTDDGAAAGSDNGAHDHKLVLETLRTRQESL